MEIPKNSEAGLKFATMSESVCDVLASIATDVLIFRKILAEKNLVSDAEFETALEAFERRLGKAYRSEIVKQLCDERDSAFERMKQRPVN
jgi:hypothetical protein